MGVSKGVMISNYLEQARYGINVIGSSIELKCGFVLLDLMRELKGSDSARVSTLSNIKV